jgi:hypothetical protein
MRVLIHTFPNSPYSFGDEPEFEKLREILEELKS